MYEVDESRNPDDPSVMETDHLRGRIAELEQVVRELRQCRSRSSASAESDDNNKIKRRVIVDRFARFKLDEAAMAEIAAAAKINGSGALELNPQWPRWTQDELAYRLGSDSSHILSGEEMVRDALGRKTFIGAPAGRSMLRRVSVSRRHS